MLRFVNICVVLALVALACVIYERKYEARALDEDIGGLRNEIETERDAVAVLRAEWSLLNRPERIERLAQKHLKLAAARPAQLVTLDTVSESDFERIRMEAADESLPAASGPPTKVKSVPVPGVAAAPAAPANFDDDLPAPLVAAAPEVPKPAEPKTHLLANEQAEADRSAALEDKTLATAPAPTESKRYFKVKVRDAGTLEVGLLPTDTVVIRLEGINACEADETCKKESGTSWPCGAKARTALAHFIRYRAVACKLAPGGESKEFAARCSLMGQDLSTWLVRQGWATPQAGAEPELAKALDAAKTERLGLWQAE
jgi:cell division protein FtsL